MVSQHLRIWAFGSGKGGVGKSLITANVAVTLARKGYRCVLLDADLGGANLHTIVGGTPAKRTLADFLSSDVAYLGEVVSATPTPGLALISGARAGLESPHVKYFLKQKLLRQLSTLGFDFVLLDLAAGTDYNTLDFFLAAELGALVVVPEPTSIENASHFLKAAFYRRLKAGFLKAGVKEEVAQAMKVNAEQGLESPRELTARVRAIDPQAGEALAREMAGFRPRLILNQVRRAGEADLGKEMTLSYRDYLGIEIEYLGAIASDDTVRRALREHSPSTQLFPASPFSNAVREITSRLLESGPPATAAEQIEEDYRILGLRQGCRITDVIDAHKRLKKLYSQSALASYSVADEKRRAVMLERIEQAARRMVQKLSGAVPIDPARPSQSPAGHQAVSGPGRP